MTIEGFLSRLTGVKAHGQDSWMACCPHHEDSSPSLSISRGKSQPIVLKCFAGCSTDEVLGSVGLTIKDIVESDKPGGVGPYKDPLQHVTVKGLADYMQLPVQVLEGFGLRDGVTTTDGQRHQVVEVPYLDDDKSELRVKIRTALNGKPKYRWKPGEGNFLYGEWRIWEARKQKSLIFCEGESDAWSLWAVGALGAMGIPGSEAEKVICKNHLEGIAVVWICQDNDKPGADLAAKIAKIVDGFAPGIKVRIVSPPKPYKDITEWRKSFSTLGEFKVALGAAFNAAPVHGQKVSPLVKMSTVTRQHVAFGWKPYIPEGYGTIMAGKPGQGKSFAALALCTAVSRGTGICGTEVVGPSNVILMSAEDDIAAVLRPRLDGLGADLDKIFAFRFDQADFIVGLEGAQRLDELCREHNPKLIVLDPLVSFLDSNVNMNQANQVRAAMRPMIAVAARHKASLLITAHVHKGSPGEAMDAVMGSVDFGAVVRSVLVVYRDPEAEQDGGSPQQSYVIAHAKHNLTKPGKSLRYVIRPASDNPDDPEFLWNGESKYTANELRTIRQEDLQLLADARAFFIHEIGFGGSKPVADLRAKARKIGMSMGIMERARRELGINQVPCGSGWSWSMPYQMMGGE